MTDFAPESTIGNTTGWQPFDCADWRVDIVREVTGLTADPYGPGGLVPPTFLSAQYVDAFALGIPDAPARLNGGNSCRWLAPVPVGARLERRSTVTAATRKDGRTGRLDIYTVETVYRRPGGEEVARLGYTPIRRYPGETRPSGPSRPDEGRFEAPAGAVRSFEATPSARDLVRYAVATDDLYEAHYDERFARDRGLPGVIVHGLLKMAWLARGAVEPGGGFVREISASYRGMDLVGEPVSVWCAERAADDGVRTLELFAVSASGALSTSGTATVEPDPPSIEDGY